MDTRLHLTAKSFFWPPSAYKTSRKNTQFPIRTRIPAPESSHNPKFRRQSKGDPERMAQILQPEEEDAGKSTELGVNDKELIEALERLEEEAIMGEDEGREATDYKRRARLFDKSSRVFQALKEANKGSDGS